MPRLAANLSWLFTELPFEERFEAAAQAGFDHVECLFPYDVAPLEVSRRLREHRLEMELFNLPPGDWSRGERGLACLPRREMEFASGLDDARRFADICGVPRLHAMAGIRPASLSCERARDTYLANLRRAARSLAEDGRDLVIEPINVRDMPGYFLASLEDALEVLHDLGEPNVGIQADLYHLQICGGDVVRRLGAVLPNVLHVQIAGVPDRAEPDLGELRYELVFDLLDRWGYEGVVGCEYRPSTGTTDGLGWASPWLRGAR